MYINLLIYILMFIIVIIIVSIADYFFASRNLKEVNNKIQNNPSELNSPEKKEMHNRLLRQTYMWGPFTFIEARKLKKALDKYK